MDTVGLIEFKSEGHLTLKSFTFYTFTSFRKRQEWHLTHGIARLYMSKLGLCHNLCSLTKTRTI